MKSIITTLFILCSVALFSQIRIGSIQAYHIEDQEITECDLTLYYPREPTRVKGALWLVIDNENFKSLGTILELTEHNRHNVIDLLKEYQKLAREIETPKKLPSSHTIGYIGARMAFEDSTGAYHLAPEQNILFYLKFNIKGEKSLAMSTSELVSKIRPNVKHTVPLIWFGPNKVEDFLSEISDENINSFLKSQKKIIAPEASDVFQN